MKKRFSEKGFTLIEMVVVIAIIGVLAAILVPSILSYIRKARLKADVTTGRMIYEQVVSLITSEDEAYESFYMLRNTSGATGISWGRPKMFGSKTDMTIKVENESSYCMRVSTQLNGNRQAATGGGKNGKTWVSGIAEVNKFDQALNSNIDDIIGSDNDKFSLPMRSTDYNDMELNRWYICFRVKDMGTDVFTDDCGTIEIWAGNSKGHWGAEPNYRVFPAPGPRVAKIKYKDGHVSTT